MTQPSWAPRGARCPQSSLVEDIHGRNVTAEAVRCWMNKIICAPLPGFFDVTILNEMDTVPAVGRTLQVKSIRKPRSVGLWDWAVVGFALRRRGTIGMDGARSCALSSVEEHFLHTDAKRGHFCGHFAVVSMAFASLFATFFPLFLEIQHAGHS